ncbi:MAG: hypothetical protein ACXAB8_07770 [Promethearchaeota archaeon]
MVVTFTTILSDWLIFKPGISNDTIAQSCRSKEGEPYKYVMLLTRVEFTWISSIVINSFPVFLISNFPVSLA